MSSIQDEALSKWYLNHSKNPENLLPHRLPLEYLVKVLKSPSLMWDVCTRIVDALSELKIKNASHQIIYSYQLLTEARSFLLLSKNQELEYDLEDFADLNWVLDIYTKVFSKNFVEELTSEDWFDDTDVKERFGEFGLARMNIFLDSLDRQGFVETKGSKFRLTKESSGCKLKSKFQTKVQERIFGQNTIIFEKKSKLVDDIPLSDLRKLWTRYINEMESTQSQIERGIIDRNRDVQMSFFANMLIKSDDPHDLIRETKKMGERTVRLILKVYYEYHEKLREILDNPEYRVKPGEKPAGMAGICFFPEDNEVFAKVQRNKLASSSP